MSPQPIEAQSIAAAIEAGDAYEATLSFKAKLTRLVRKTPLQAAAIATSVIDAAVKTVATKAPQFKAVAATVVAEIPAALTARFCLKIPATSAAPLLQALTNAAAALEGAVVPATSEFVAAAGRLVDTSCEDPDEKRALTAALSAAALQLQALGVATPAALKALTTAVFDPNAAIPLSARAGALRSACDHLVRGHHGGDVTALAWYTARAALQMVIHAAGTGEAKEACSVAVSSVLTSAEQLPGSAVAAVAAAGAGRGAVDVAGLAASLRAASPNVADLLVDAGSALGLA